MFNNLYFFFYKVSIKNRFLYKMFFSFAPTSSSAAHDDGNNDSKYNVQNKDVNDNGGNLNDMVSSKHWGQRTLDNIFHIYKLQIYSLHVDGR